MAKEINFFTSELEETAEEAALPETLAKPVYVQTPLPGFMEKIHAAQEQHNREKQARQQVKGIIEALLFASSEPISFTKIREVVDTLQPIRPKLVRDLLQELANEYITQNRAFRIEEIASGFLLRSCEEFSPYIDILYKNKRAEKLSHPAAEVLAIIAYKGPITRPQIDAIRGVDSSGTVYSLLERNLIEPVGKLEAPGRPTLYGTTPEFLKHFGLKEINELPGWQPRTDKIKMKKMDEVPVETPAKPE